MTDNETKDQDYDDAIDALLNNASDSVTADDSNISSRMNNRVYAMGIVFFLIGLGITFFMFNNPKDQFSSIAINPVTSEITGNTIATPSLIALQPNRMVSNVALTQQEYKHLLFMREEEKLARDVYTLFYNQWKLSIFSSIAKSEQRHTDSIAGLLQQYNITDPAINAAYGVFQDEKLARTYQQLTSKGNVSALEALKVGALIEEVDIKDLDTAIEATDKADILTVYKNIRQGSYHHLRAFVHSIELYGQTYQSTILGQERVDKIVKSPIGMPLPFGQ